MINKFLGVLTILLCTLTTYAQKNPGEVKKLIFEKDSLFWVAYNNCDMPAMQALFSEDVEFYHDKGGISKTRDTIMAITKRNLCSNDNFRLRREAVKGTVNVYVMTKNDVPYGAIISGEHIFYVNEKGKEERLDGQARFTQLWILDKGEWKMTRVLSYDHGPAKQNTALQEIQVASAVLDKLAGKYKSPNNMIEVFNNKGKLKLVVDKQEYNVLAASETEFFLPGRPLIFKFSGKKLSVIENGRVVEEAVKL